MSSEVRVPDIGDFIDIPVIEVLVKPGDRVKKDESLVTLESDKATMEVPSPGDGTVENVTVKVGDKVSQGTVILTLQSAEAQQSAPAPQPAPQPQQQPQQPSQQQAVQQQSASPAQMVPLTVPDIGDFHEVPVIEVMIKPGDRIAKDASLVALESDKATMEVPAAAAGVVRDVKIRVGDKVSQGAIIALLETESAAAPQPQASAPKPAPAPVAPPQSVSAPQTIVQPPAQSQPAMSGNGAVHASPSIRRFARELGVDLHEVHASGPNGRVTREDVQSFVKRALQDGGRPSRGAAAAGGFAVASWPKVDFASFGEIERKSLTRIQKLSGPNLHRNWVMIPHVTQNDDADVTELEAFRSQLNTELSKSGVKVTMLALLIKASIAALKAYPQFNSSLDGDELVLKKYYNIGFAADTPGGLVVPVVKDADRKGIADLARETSDLAGKARDGKLALSDMQGGTFTISSLGSIGGTYFSPIINAPEVAILGACRAAMRPVWNGSAFVPRLMQPLSLSYDHRVIDGAAAARFITLLSSVLSDLRRALL